RKRLSHFNTGRPFLVFPEIGVVVGWWWFDWSVLADRLDLVKKARFSGRFLPHVVQKSKLSGVKVTKTGRKNDESFSLHTSWDGVYERARSPVHLCNSRLPVRHSDL